MTTENGCDRFDAIADELALGIATGEQRAEALAHVSGCQPCRERLEGLAGAVDELLLLAPLQEPPVGFESRLQRHMDAERAPREAPPGRARSGRGWRVALPAAIAGLAILLLGASWIGSRDDRRLAGDYREALAEVNGNYFTTFALFGSDGQRAGSGFAYEGDPSWVFVTLEAPPAAVPPGRYELQVSVGGEGTRELATPLVVTDGHGSAGATFEGDLDTVGSLRLLRPGAAPIDLSVESSRAIYP